MISLHEVWGMYLVSWLPGVIAFRVALPFEEILELFSPSMMSVAPYLLHFIFRFSQDKVRWWPGIVGSVRVRFDVWGEQAGMEHGVDVPLMGQLELIGHGRDDSSDLKRSITFGG